MTRQILVLQSFPEPRATTNPYLVLLSRSLQSTTGLTLHTFTWRRALLARIDVFHAHWPENLLRSHSPWRSRARQLLFAMFLVKIATMRTAVVRTVHNLDQHEGVSRAERWLLRIFDRLTVVRIALNYSTPDAGKPMVVIPHGHYRDWFDGAVVPTTEPGRLGYIGLIRSYKAVDTLVRAFLALPQRHDLRLDIAGKPSPPELGDELTVLAFGDDRITLRFDYISDGELADRIGRAEIVVLPYREMHNSGGALLALSLDRPVLVPRNEINDQLSREVGPGWVYTYTPPIRGEDLVRAFTRSRSGQRCHPPDLGARDWATAGTAHVAAYREAMSLRSWGGKA